MSNPDGVLDAIDACLTDALSPDAMRWTPAGLDPTPRNVQADRVAEWADEHTGFQLTGWQRHYLNALTPAVDLPAPDGLLRINMPDSTESLHRVVSVIPGESLGEYWLTIEPAVTAITEAADALRSAAETALTGLGKAFGPFLSATTSALHKGSYGADRKHYRHCPTCNPAGFPKGMSINRAEYHRRRRSRR